MKKKDNFQGFLENLKQINDDTKRYIEKTKDFDWKSFLQNLEDKPKPPLFVFTKNGEVIEEKSIICMAAGSASTDSEKLPNAKFDLPEDLFKGDSAVIDRDSSTEDLLIELTGGSPHARQNTILKVFYKNGESNTFKGKDILQGGAWRIEREKEKESGGIVRVEISYND